ncbi:hypothetical protein, partial [Pediococcus stilesii]|uniref:hypothetical protein n=1 Tax=Pediococcus stilesii TaxID=331679 RepID=UPI001BB14884
NENKRLISDRISKTSLSYLNFIQMSNFFVALHYAHYGFLDIIKNNNSILIRIIKNLMIGFSNLLIL